MTLYDHTPTRMVPLFLVPFVLGLLFVAVVVKPW
jgi:hypothetical protein